jgi:hypothetical protein
MSTSRSPKALAVARAYHDAWRERHYEAAWSLIDADVLIDVPINAYDGKASFVEAAERTREMAAKVDEIAEFGDETRAVLIYDMTLPVGSLRIAECFTVVDGRISEILHIHDTAALRAAGVG